MALVAQFGCSPVGFDRTKEVVISEKAPQTAAVMRESVVASVDVADNQGDQFAFNLAQCLCGPHGSFIDCLVPGHGGRVQRVNLHDVVHPARDWVCNAGVDGSHVALPLVLADGVDPGDGSARSRMEEFESDRSLCCCFEESLDDPLVDLDHNVRLVRSRIAQGAELGDDPVL